MTSRLKRSFGPWIVHHAFEFKWFYLGAFLSLFILQELQSEIPEKIRILTKVMAQGELNKVSVWIFVLLAVGILVFRTLSRLMFFYPARVQQKLLRMELLEQLEKVPHSRYADRPQGQIFQILFDDINNVRAFIGFGMLQISNLIIAAFVLIPKVNATDSYLWPAFSPLFASVLFFSIVTLINQKIFKKMMEKKGEIQQYIIEAYEAKQSIKNFHQEGSFIRGFATVSAQELSLFFKSSIGFAITGPYIKLGLGASLLWASYLIRAHGGSTSDLVYFSGFLYLFLEPVMFLSWVAMILSQGFAAWKRMKELHNQLTSPSKDEDELKRFDFQVTDDSMKAGLKFWGQDLKVEIKKHQWSVIVGETGSGKSFLLSQLASSMILRGHKVSLVAQEPYLFNDTIQENIFLGNPATQEKIEEAKNLIQIFQLDSLASNLDEVLNLEVGENGKRLSGGQMKRVALVRSLLSGADYFFWDDPFSSVDIILEKKILARLRQEEFWKNKTFLITSHRLTTVRLVNDLIFVTRNHGIASQGLVETQLKDADVARFFKEQMVELPLA